MSDTQGRIARLVKPIFNEYQQKMIPADKKQLEIFRNNATKRSIPPHVIDQLIEFYSISNGVPCFDGFDFHQCDDEIIFEWWESDQSLWLASRGDDVLRWADDKFCLGDASNVSYGTKYEFALLIALLEFAFNYWYPAV